MCQHRFLIFMLVLGYHSDCDNMYTEIQSHVYVKGTNKILQIYTKETSMHLYDSTFICHVYYLQNPFMWGKGTQLQSSTNQWDTSMHTYILGAFEHFCRGALNPKFTFDKHF